MVRRLLLNLPELPQVLDSRTVRSELVWLLVSLDKEYTETTQTLRGRNGTRNESSSISRRRRQGYVGLVLLLAAVLVAIVSNLDNLAAGIAFGVHGTRIARMPNLIIAAITMTGTAAAMTSGKVVSQVLAPTVASALAASIIIAIGAQTILGSFSIGFRRSGLRSRSSQDSAAWASLVPTMNGELTRANAFSVGIALGLNNIGTGVGAGVAGLSPIATTFLAGALSLLCVGGGSRAGAVLGRLVIARRARLTSGFILLGLGTAMLTRLA